LDVVRLLRSDIKGQSNEQYKRSFHFGFYLVADS
jgi:hypothetical protein